jgi:hypothetical protein
MNCNEIPLPPPLLPSLITKKQTTNNDEHDLQKSKLKNMVIDELKSFFVSRNQNYRQQNDDINSGTNLQFKAPILTQRHPIQQTKQIVQHIIDPKQTITNKGNQ